MWNFVFSFYVYFDIIKRQARDSMVLEKYEEHLCEQLKKHGIELNEIQLSQFRKYADLLVDWNTRMNLTAITDMEEIYVKHFLDCVLPSFCVKMEGSLCDVGAGAGFPSIPLKIVYPDLRITILEPLQKRCVFLNALVKELQLTGVEICNVRAEDYAKTHREKFSIVSARAVANLTMLSELCIPLVKENGIFLAMKGSSGLEEKDTAEYAIRVLGCKLEAEDIYELDDAKRMNFVFRKVKKTPVKYPRMFAKIKKEPLVRNQ